MHRHANGIQALARMLRYKGNSRMTTFAPLSRLRPHVSKTANNNMYITMIVFFFFSVSCVMLRCNCMSVCTIIGLSGQCLVWINFHYTMESSHRFTLWLWGDKP